MPALHIRNVDDAIIAALKERASRNHRSLEGEVRDLLGKAVGRRPSRPRSRRLALKTVKVGHPASFSRSVIHQDDDR